MLPRLKFSLVVLLFYTINTNEGNVSNEILSILPNVTRDLPLHANDTHSSSIATFHNQKNVESIRVSNKILLRIPFLDSKMSPLICFPWNDEDYRNVYIMSHITCRMMGFMTFSSIRPKMSPLNRERMKAENLICSNLQRGFPCMLLQNRTEECRMITEVTCGACNGTIKGFKGIIKSPGFPFASFDDVTCEWNIIVPEHHGINLLFNQFDTMDVESADLPCHLHNPYVHIMYGIQSKVTINRYCRLDEVKNLSIPFHSVKIIVFTGLQQRQGTRVSKNELGISITFEATVPAEENHGGSPAKMLALFLLGVIFIACIILCHYMQKYKLFDCMVKDRNTRLFTDPYALPRQQNENINLNRCPIDGANAGKVEYQRNPKMVYETEKGINEYSSLLDTSARFIPSLIPVGDDDDVAESINANFPNTLDLRHDHHGQEDPNRLSVFPNYHHYHSLRTPKPSSSKPSMEDVKNKLKPSLSTC